MSYPRPRDIAATLALVTAFGLAGASDRATALTAERPACAEDAPCWNWATMGNAKRGVTLKSGRLAVVGVCRYQRLVVARRIDRTVTPKLSGDRTATTFDCD